MSNNGELEDVESLREPQREIGRAFPSVEVPARSPRAWRRAPRDLSVRIAGAGREMGLDDFLTVTSSTSCVVVVDGVLVHEWYADGVTDQDRLLGNSATKSALALVTGLAVADRRLDLSSGVVDLVPELGRSGYRNVTVRQLLTMTSGVGWVEDYRDPDSLASRTMSRWREGVGGVRTQLLDVPEGDEPGSRYAYCSADSLVLDWVREVATGEPFAEAFAPVWGAVGAERPAVVGLDGPSSDGGIAMAAAALAVTARDWARIGWLQVDGRVHDTGDGRALVDPAWVDASSTPQRAFLLPGRLPSTITTHAGFGYHWWPLDPAGTRVMADGMRGQFVYVDRPRRTVVVKTSAWPYADAWWDRQCRDLCYLALPAIAEAAAES
jgi:CubicO group peptidase (beta-lactamase class C family)